MLSLSRKQQSFRYTTYSPSRKLLSSRFGLKILTALLTCAANPAPPPWKGPDGVKPAADTSSFVGSTPIGEMDSKKSQLKLTRTHSSLLRYSPTFRSSSVSEAEEDKKRRDPSSTGYHRTGSNRVGPLLAAVLSTATVIFLFYCRRDDAPTSENVLLALIFVAITLYFTSRNKRVIRHNFLVIKNQFWQFNAKRLGLGSSNRVTRQVQWFIGDSDQKPHPKTGELGARTAPDVIREGVEFYSNGDFYEGEFHKGRCNGSGVYNYFVKGRYEGDWVDGKYDGFGIESWARGSRYRGQYRGGLRHGFGVYRFYTGDSYSGEWWNGQSHGFGAQSCGDGSCYVGEFKCGVKHGLGWYHFRNGDRYAGEYFGDKIHGFGIYHFANGHCYEGAWHDGREQGMGMYTFRNGDMRCGEWNSGSLKNPLPPLTDSILRAVQAVRKAADNAIHIRRVDEEVNKAVTAANRAATAARVAAVKAVQNRMDGKFCDLEV